MIDGRRLRELRKAKGLSQTELGNILGVSKSSVCCYEKGLRTPTVETVLDLMHLFGVSADYLLGTDNIIKTVEDSKVSYHTITKEEIKFLKELKKDKFLADILFEDPARLAELIKKKIG